MKRDHLSFPFEKEGIDVLLFMPHIPVDKQLAFRLGTGKDFPQVYVCVLHNKKQPTTSITFQFASTENDFADRVLREFITSVANCVKENLEKKSVSDVWSDFINKLDLDFPDDDDEQDTPE